MGIRRERGWGHAGGTVELGGPAAAAGRTRGTVCDRCPRDHATLARRCQWLGLPEPRGPQRLPRVPKGVATEAAALLSAPKGNRLRPGAGRGLRAGPE